MSYHNHAVLCPCVASVLAFAMSALPAHAQEDALSLESAPTEKVEAPSNTKWFVEGAIGNAPQRYQPDSIQSERASLDLLYSGRVGTGLRAVVSDRLDLIHTNGPEPEPSRNRLREAYLGWQPGGGDTAIDLGRINLRNGPAYGYNPTD